jgi:signal peptidase I
MTTPAEVWSPPAPAQWTPNPWIAVLLAATLQWPSMLYLGRPLLAALYFLTLLALLVGTVTGLPWTMPVRTLPLTLGALSLLCALHAWWLAARQPPRPRRPELAVAAILATAWIFAAFLLLRGAMFDFYRLPSTAMYPSLPLGSFVVVRKLGFGSVGILGEEFLRFEASEVPARGDVVVFTSPRDPDMQYIKRVVGMPGDHVEYRAGRLHLDGQAAPLERLRAVDGKVLYRETLGPTHHEIALSEPRRLDLGNGSWVVPAGHYFVSGDNRDNSEDSRYWGFVPADHLVGVLVGSIQGPRRPDAGEN